MMHSGKHFPSLIIFVTYKAASSVALCTKSWTISLQLFSCSFLLPTENLLNGQYVSSFQIYVVISGEDASHDWIDWRSVAETNHKFY